MGTPAFLREHARSPYPVTMFLRGNFDTFKQKKIVHGSRRFELHQHAQATLGAGRLQEAVKLPPGEDLNDWLAVNVTDFYNEVSLLYGVLTDVCTPTCCPNMSAGPRYDYKWADGVRFKKPIRCSAPQYIDYMMCWAQTTLDDERLFPVRVGEPFPRNIRQTICTIFKRLFRVYAHIYVLHFSSMQEMGAEPHLNTCFRHFMLFVREFDLIEPQELLPLKELIDKIYAREGLEPAGAAGSKASVGVPTQCVSCDQQSRRASLDVPGVMRNVMRVAQSA